MSLGSNIQLTEAEKNAVAFIVDRISSDSILAFARSSQVFNKGGFRPDKPQAVKSLLKNAVFSAQTVDKSVRAFLAANCECATITGLLSAGMLKSCSRAFEILYSRQMFRIARLLDPRLNVRLPAMKEAGSDEKTEYSEDDRKWAREHISHFIAPLAGAFPAGGDSEPSCAGQASFQVRQELTRLREDSRQLKGARERIAKLESALSASEKKTDSLTARAEEAEKKLGAACNRAETAEAAVERYRKNIDDYKAAAVESRLAEEFAGWLGGKRLARIRALCPGGLADDNSAGDKPDALFSRAQAALKLQSEADISSGVRDLLYARLEKTENLLTKCLAAQRNAICAVPEIGDAIRELTEEQARLAEILHEDDSAAAISPEDAISAAIAAAGDSQLPDITHTVNKLERIGALPKQAHARLCEKINSRYAACYAKRGGSVLDSGDNATPEQILDLGRQGKIPVILLVDGHNVLFAMQSHYCRAQDHGRPSSEARKWLVEDMLRVFGNSPNVRVKIVFDGNEYSYESVAGNIEVEYSGGGTAEVEHRADRVLVQAARSLRDTGSACDMLIMTNDNGLINRIVAHGGKSVAPTVMLRWL